jgi:U3 small nucleolar RNA-associated protein 7
MIGNLAPPSKLTRTTAVDGKPTTDIPYGRLPRLERLRVSGKLDDEEENSGAEGDVETKSKRRGEREKKKMRGRDKSLKKYLRRHRKNVIDPATVLASFSFFLHNVYLTTSH